MSTPTISAVMPALNDAAHLGPAVQSVLRQDFDGQLELVIAVGPSTDATELVARRLAEDDVRVRVVDNPTGGTAAGLNAAIAAARGRIVARVDAHCELPPHYLARAMDTLARTGAANVGGIQAAEGTSPFGRAVAAAMSSPFGVGNAHFHYGGSEGPADTVYLGVFDAEVLAAVGAYDETLVRNQDYELNWRLRDAGHVVWFDPELIVKYQPRSTVRALAKQYLGYGQWKREVIKRHPRSTRIRHLVAPLTVAGLVTAAIGFAAGRRWMIIAPAVYAAAVATAATTTPQLSRGERLRLLVAFPTMHLSWGTGFWIGTRKAAGKAPRASSA